jgi:hypothetical protein
MEAKDLGGPAAVVGLDLFLTYLTETLEDGHGLGEVACGPEPAPPPAPDVACLRAMFDVAAVDPLEEDLGAPLRRVEHGRVDSDCMRPEVLAPHVGPRGVHPGDRYPGALHPVDEVNSLEDEGQRGEQRAVLHEMALEGRRVVSGDDLALECGPPVVEDLLGPVVEVEVWHLLSLSGRAIDELLDVEVGQLLEDLVGPISGVEVGGEVRRIKATAVGVHKDLEALEETVGALAVVEGALYVKGERTGLDPAQNRDADGLHEQRAAAYPVDLVGPVAIPRLEVEGPRCLVSCLSRDRSQPVSSSR